MEITWYGQSCFRITERGAATIVTDPYHENIGYERLNLKADVVTISHDAPGHANVEAVRDWRFVVNSPGEYEIGGVFVIGVPMFNRKAEVPRVNIAYVFDYNRATVLHLGDLDYVPTQAQLEALGSVDVLMVPVGGGAGLNSSQAAEVVAMLEPLVVVPMHYQTPHSLLDLAPVDKFLTEMGVTSPAEEEFLKVTKATLPETTQTVLLKYKMG